MIIYNAFKKNFHARICMFTAQGLGRKKHSFTSTHRKKHNKLAHTHTHTTSRDKWEAELQATVKEVRLESGLERINRGCFPDAPEQGKG